MRSLSWLVSIFRDHEKGKRLKWKENPKEREGRITMTSDRKVKMLYRPSHYQMPVIAVIQEMKLFEKFGLDVDLKLAETSTEAEKLLHSRGIITIPDFIAGCGGSLSMDGLFGPESHPSVQDVLDHVENRMRFIVKKVLERSRQESITPREAALSICSEAPIYPEAKPYGPLS